MARPLDSPSEAPLEADALRPKHGWRATLARRKRRLAALAALGGFGLAALLAPPTPPSGFSADLKANLAAQLTTLLGQPVAVEGLRLNPIEAVGLGAALRLTFEVGEPRDLYTARARVSARGVPVAVSGLVNLTRSPKADDRLLWASADALIYATRGATPTPLSRAVVALDFTPPQAPREGPLIAFIAQRRYGHPRRPRRVDVLLGDAEAHEATLEGQRLRLVTSEGPVEVDLRTGATQPEGVRVVMGAGQERGLDLLADALRHAPLLGVEGVMGLERLLFDAQDQLSRWRHAAPFAPAPPPVQIHALSAPLAWPPQDLRREGDAPDEGVWGPLPGLGVEAPARRAFLRVDPRRPYQRVYLFAFDSRAVQLRFVGGARHPIGDTGARGSGRVPEAARPRLLAAFNGAFKATHGQFGAIEAGRVLVTPKRGAATVAMTIDGRAAFGVWDADTLRPPWVDLRQNLSPLISEGKPSARRSWGGVVARLDEARTPRSALGVTDSGILIYAWSEASSARGLAEAMAQVGVHTALHLDLNPGHTGLTAFSHPRDGGAPIPHLGAAEMDIEPERYLGDAARGFFYLTHLQAPPPPWRRVGMEIDAAPFEGLVLYRLEQRLTQLLLIPGSREPRPLVDPRPPELVLEGAPSAWLPLGTRRPEGPMGFVVDGRPWRFLAADALTLAMDRHGQLSLSRAPLASTPTWAIQGAPLVEGGRLACCDGPSAPAPTLRVSGLGRAADGALLYGQGPALALASALRAAGAEDGLILGHAPRAGVDLISLRGDTLWLQEAPSGAPRPGQLAAEAGSALLVSPQPGAAGATVTRSFR